jgi:hypothetical protein
MLDPETREHLDERVRNGARLVCRRDPASPWKEGHRGGWGKLGADVRLTVESITMHNVITSATPEQTYEASLLGVAVV